MNSNDKKAKRWNDLSVLIAGCGSIGKRHARVLQSLGVRDVRACDINSEARKFMAEQTPSVNLYDSFEAGLDDHPDTVFICTEPILHIPMADEAIRAGCHVMCEKPLSDSDKGIDDLIKLAGQTRKKVMVGLCFRYHEGILKACNYLHTGKIGRIVSIRALMGEHLPEARPDYRDLFSSKYNGAFDLMHDLDLVLWIADYPVKKVCCLFGNYSDIGIQAPDLVELLIDFEKHCAASVHLDFFQRPRRRQLELICTEGMIIVEFARWDVCTVSIYTAHNGSWRCEEIQTERDDMFRAEDKEFLQSVAENLPIKCTLEEGRKSLDVIMAARHSYANTGSL